jgi:hypothetical protein
MVYYLFSWNKCSTRSVLGRSRNVLFVAHVRAEVRLFTVAAAMRFFLMPIAPKCVWATEKQTSSHLYLPFLLEQQQASKQATQIHIHKYTHTQVVVS